MLPLRVNIETFLTLAKSNPVFDVRSPAEYAYAHIPDAVSLPIFNDDERKQIGTAFKQISRQKAIKLGFAFFGPKMNALLDDVEKELKKYEGNTEVKLLVHCWRGGMRSAAMAWLLQFYGYDVVLLEGGYKSYRHLVLEQLNLPFHFQVLGGHTGSGKTEILQELKTLGFPVIDLENLACHKGSAFGALGMKEQPSQEHFENILFQELSTYYSYTSDTGFHQPKVIWIENESQRIGLVNLPKEFYGRMQLAPVVQIEIPFEQRLQFILSNYGNFEKEKLVNAIIRIQKRLGGLDTKNAICFLLENEVENCFRILLSYYDKLYKLSSDKRTTNPLVVISDSVNPILNANKIAIHFSEKTQ